MNGDVHGAAADEAVVPAKILIELKGEEAVLVFVHELLSAGADFGFDAAAAKGADGIAVAEDEHGSAFALRGAAAGANDGAEGDGFAESGSADELSQEINHNGKSGEMDAALFR